MIFCFYTLLGVFIVASVIFLLRYSKRISWWFKNKEPQERIESYDLHRFAVVIPARNEGETVIPLMESIQKQTYDKAMFDLYVIVKDPLDPTMDMIQAILPDTMFFIDEEQTTKGHALNYGMKRICTTHPGKYDGYLIIDADCILDPMFLCEMNRAFGSGKDVYNSKLVVKNYLSKEKHANSWASYCNGLIWTLMSELGNRAKSDLGIVTMTLGTGLLIKGRLIEEWNGWPFLETLTEDMELQRCCALNHYSCEYVSYAICYVEEATSLKMTNIRRNRWMTGVVDCDRLFDAKLKENIKTEQDKNNFYAIHSLYSVYGYVGFLCFLFITALIFGITSCILRLSYGYAFFILCALAFLFLYSGLWVMTYRCLKVDKEYLPMKRTTRLWILFTHPFYYMGYIGIMTKIFTFVRAKEWKKIKRVEFKETEV